MPKDALIKNLAKYELDHLKVLTRNMLILSTICSVVVASAIGILVTFWTTHAANQDSVARGVFNCQIQREGRIEGNKRVVYTRVVKKVAERFPAVRQFLKAEHPNLYPLPAITDLPIPDCTKLPGAGPDANDPPKSQ